MTPKSCAIHHKSKPVQQEWEVNISLGPGENVAFILAPDGCNTRPSIPSILLPPLQATNRIYCTPPPCLALCWIMHNCTSVLTRMANAAISIKAFWFSFFPGLRGGVFVFWRELEWHKICSVCVCVCVCICLGGPCPWGAVALLACQAIYNFVWLRLKHMGSPAVVNMQIWNEHRLTDPDMPLCCEYAF